MTGKTIEQRAEELLLRIDDHADIFVSTAGPIRDMILAALRSVESDTREACVAAVKVILDDADDEQDRPTTRLEAAIEAIRSQGDTPDKAANSKTGSEDR